VLIGNNIVNIGASAFTTSVLVALFGTGASSTPPSQCRSS
jgi:Mg2+/Co2+ transporter CorB